MGYRIDLSNRRVGRLKVIDFDFNKNKWRCLCDCQRDKENPEYCYVTTSRLNGSRPTKSCGCLHRDVLFNDITNARFGKLVAIKVDHRDKDGRCHWLCKCDCGNEVVVPVKVLTVNGKQSCGNCLENEMIGKHYGHLTVLEKAYIKNHKQYWKCQCDCDNKTILYVSTNSLNSENTSSCGCTHYEHEDLTGLRSGMLVAEEYIGKNKWKCKCDCGNYTEVLGIDLKRKTTVSCGNHAVSMIGSEAEKEIKKFIEFLCGIKAEKVKILDIGKKKKEIDIYIPSLKLGIEYNGSAYHATENALFKDKDKYYHRDKFLQAKKQGIHLITIFDKDYEENKYLILDRLYHVIKDKDKRFILPTKDIEYTNNDYDLGEYMKDFGYEEIGQEEPTSFIYGDKFVVYRCGRTIWRRK